MVSREEMNREGLIFFLCKTMLSTLYGQSLESFESGSIVSHATC